MAVRLKIGTYIIDADANSSTTPGTTLHPDSSVGLDSDDAYINWSGTSEQVTIPFRVHVTGAGSESDLATRIKAVEDAIQEPTGDVVYEYSDTNALREWKTSNGDFSVITGTVTTEPGETDALLECVLTLNKSGVSGSGPVTSDGSDTTIPGLVDTVEVTGERVIAGRLNMVVTAGFKDGDSTAVVVASVADDGNGKAKFLFSGSPDLSAVVPGQILNFTGGVYSGQHIITSVDDGTDSVVTMTTFSLTDTGAGSIQGPTAQDNAKNFIALVRDRGAPVNKWAWMPASDAMRIVDDVAQIDLTSQDASGNRTVGGTVRVTIILREMPKALLTLEAKIRDVQSAIAMSHRSLDQRAGQQPGIDITLTGAIYTRTEANQVWDPGDTGDTTDLTDAELNTALDLIRDEAIIRLGKIGTGNIKELNRNTVRGVETGEITYVISMITSDSVILEWDEQITYRASSNSSVVSDSEANDWVYDQANKGILVVEHELRVVRLSSAPTYLPPRGIGKGAIGKRWITTEASQTTPRVIRLRGSTTNEMTFERQFGFKYRAIRTRGGLGSLARDIRTLVTKVSTDQGAPLSELIGG